ncbi:hypothetical protein RB653_001424 [Dictyostelium firmibasis]|uniref:Uncharacterized protein n=1 Tax=Dictyostelium firmibasis TaxID=79012 RepID=A0AAN7YYP1_9MYCE
MLSRATRLLSTANVCKSMVKNTTIRSFASHGGAPGGSYPGEPKPGTKMVNVKVQIGDAIYSYKHGNFIVDPIQIKELIEEQNSHVHGPGCAHGHHEGDHHDDHHDHIDPDDIEDEFPRGYFLNTPPSVPYPMNPYFLSVLAFAPIIGSLYYLYFIEDKTNKDYENFKEEYLAANPELKQKLYDITHKYPLSH